MARPEAHRSSWTPDDIAMLRGARAKGESPRDIARRLGRTEEAVRRKLRLLDAQPSDTDPMDYFRRRAAEERRRADQTKDSDVAAIHTRLADMYDEVLAGVREPLSAQLR